MEFFGPIPTYEYKVLLYYTQINQLEDRRIKRFTNQ